VRGVEVVKKWRMAEGTNDIGEEGEGRKGGGKEGEREEELPSHSRSL
jgi:hypothetical protein